VVGMTLPCRQTVNRPTQGAIGLYLSNGLFLRQISLMEKLASLLERRLQ